MRSSNINVEQFQAVFRIDEILSTGSGVIVMIKKIVNLLFQIYANLRDRSYDPRDLGRILKLLDEVEFLTRGD